MVEKQNIAISLVWYERYIDCSRSYKTTQFYNDVERFYNSLLDIDHDKRAIRSMVTKYIDDEWSPSIRAEIVERTAGYDESSKAAISKLVVDNKAEDLFHFIIQAIQDSGIGWPNQDQIDSYLRQD